MTLFDWYFKDPDPAKPQVDETVAFSDEIQLEDIDICEAVQRGLRSSTYDKGRFSPQRENGVHHFHGLYEALMDQLFSRWTHRALHGAFARITCCRPDTSPRARPADSRCTSGTRL